jgi:hypothetical protein
MCELGIQLTSNEVDFLLDTVDTDESGGLDLKNFIKAINYPSKVQQWTDTLPLSPLLAHCLSFKGGESSNEPLRVVSNLSADELRASTEAYCETLQVILADAVRELRKCFDAMDKLAPSSVENDNSKFQTLKMSAGGVDEFFQELLGRVGKCFSCVSYV